MSDEEIKLPPEPGEVASPGHGIPGPAEPRPEDDDEDFATEVNDDA